MIPFMENSRTAKPVTVLEISHSCRWEGLSGRKPERNTENFLGGWTTPDWGIVVRVYSPVIHQTVNLKTVHLIIWKLYLKTEAY